MSDSKTSSHYRRTSYAQANRNAERVKTLRPGYQEYLALKHEHARIGDNWWKDPAMWLGDEWLDVARLKGHDRKEQLRIFFKRVMGGKRKGSMSFSIIMKLAQEFPEFLALLRIYLESENAGRDGKLKYKLTRRQRQAVKAAEEALRLGWPNVHQYVAEQLRIGRRAASYLLERASVRLELETFLFGDLFQSIDRDGARFIRVPSQEAVRRQMASMPRDCAGAGEKFCEEVIPRGDMPLCWGCRQVFGIRGEWAGWLEYRVNDIEREHRQKAIEALGFRELAEETEVLRIAA